MRHFSRAAGGSLLCFGIFFFSFSHQKTATEPWRKAAPAPADGGCGKQIEVSFVKKKRFQVHTLKLSSPAGSLFESAELTAERDL